VTFCGDATFSPWHGWRQAARDWADERVWSPIDGLLWHMDRVQESIRPDPCSMRARRLGGICAEMSQLHHSLHALRMCTCSVSNMIGCVAC
jgi:hypothetical protein